MNSDDVLKEMGTKGDQLTLIAVLTENLDKESLERVQAPWKRICKRIQDLEEAQERRNRILSLVQEALGQLRLDMKYLVFDLEATRRERDELKAKYES